MRGIVEGRRVGVGRRKGGEGREGRERKGRQLRKCGDSGVTGKGGIVRRLREGGEWRWIVLRVD